MATAVAERIRSTNKVTKVATPLHSATSRKGYSIDEVREMGYAKLSAHYGVDFKTL